MTAQIDYIEFIKKTFVGNYRVNWHHRVTAKYIQDWIFGNLPDGKRNLMIFEPPRHGKSEQVDRMLPPYIFGHYPTHEIIFSTYAQPLANSMSLSAQSIIKDPRYQELFPGLGISTKKKAAEEWHTNLGGVYKAVGVGGGLTGFGGDFMILDDPYKDFEAANSPKIRGNTKNWYDSVFRTRRHLNAPMLITMTRWHEDDLVGELLEEIKTDPLADQFYILNFPGILDKTNINKKHHKDPRKLGKSLWPDFKTAEEILSYKKTSPPTYHAMYQQRPLPAGGGKIKSAWIQEISSSEIPEDVNWIRFWWVKEFGNKDSLDHFSVTCLAAMTDYQQYVIKDIERFDCDWTETRQLILDRLEREENRVWVNKPKRDQEDMLESLIKDSLGLIQDVELQDAMVWTADAKKGNLLFVADSEEEKKTIVELKKECSRYTGPGKDRRENQVNCLAHTYIAVKTSISVVAALWMLKKKEEAKQLAS